RYWLMVATYTAAFPTDPAAVSCPGCVVTGTTDQTSHAAGDNFPYVGTSRLLSAGAVYYWKVQAWNTNGSQGNYSSAWSFSTAIGPCVYDPAIATYTVSGKVVDIYSAGMANVTANLTPQGCISSRVYRTTTSASGDYVFSGVSTGSYWINLFRFNYNFLFQAAATPYLLPVNVVAGQGNVAASTAVGTALSTSSYQIATPIYDFVQATTTLIGGSTIQFFSATSSYKMDYGGSLTVTVTTQSSIGIYTQNDRLMLVSTTTMQADVGSYLNVQASSNVSVAIATAASGGLIFKSTDAQTTVTFGEEAIKFKLPASMDTYVQEFSTAIVLQTTGTALISYGVNLNLELPPQTALSIATTSVLGGAWTFVSTAADVGLKFGGGQISFDLPQGMDTFVKEISGGVIVQTTGAAIFDYGRNAGLYLSSQTAVTIATSAYLAGGSSFLSTATTRIKYGPTIDLTLPPALQMDVAEATSGLIVRSTGSMDLSLSNKLNVAMAGQANLEISTAASANAWIFDSASSATAVSFADDRIKFHLPKAMDTYVQEFSTAVVVRTTGTALMSYGTNLALQMPPQRAVAIATASAYFAVDDGWVLSSTATGAGLNFAGGRVNLGLPSGLETLVKEDPQTVVIKTTAAATLDFQSHLGLVLPVQADMRISTVSAIEGGVSLVSTVSFSLALSSGALNTPAASPVSLKENSDNFISLKATAAATLAYTGNMEITLPSNIIVDLTAKATDTMVLRSTASVPVSISGVTFHPSSGVVEVTNLADRVGIALGSEAVAGCDLTLPTTAQKTVEVALSNQKVSGSTRTVGLEIEPDGLDKQVNLTVRVPSAAKSATISTPGLTLHIIDDNLALEIEASTPVVIDKDRGATVTFNYNDNDLSGRTTDSLRVAMASSPTASSWEVLLSSEVIVTSKSVKAKARHFSVYRLLSAEVAILASSGTVVITDPSVSASSSIAVARTGSSNITVDVPAGAFTESLSITIAFSSSGFQGGVTSNAASLNTAVGVGVVITPSKDLQPLKEVSLTVPYLASDLTTAGVSNENLLILARYDETKSVWVPLPSTVDATAKTVTAKTNHFSTFQIMQASPSSSVQDAKVFPNPLRPPKGHTGFTFANLPADAMIKIYTLTGSLIRELTASASGLSSWDSKNESGETMASGVYFALI
ncbi:MAG: carboxypeptidase regulatory-like domain-containing protein, partial [Elusimicrobia bacterium]|nr:carboxypeptidase regulatory-like domain-containing protein [Elusimicrobiota bacterium]